MKIILSTLCFVFCLTAFAQKGKTTIEFNPVALVDEARFPAIEAGVEFYLSDKISFYNEAGIKYRKSYYEGADTSFIGSKGFKFKTELRYNITTTKRGFRNIYIAVNGFYNTDTHNTSIGYYYRGDSLDERGDDFGVKKSVMGFNVLFGLKKTLWNRFSFNAYAGPGLRFVNITTRGKEFDRNRDKYLGSTDVTINDIKTREDATEKASSIINITLGIRLCYRL